MGQGFSKSSLKLANPQIALLALAALLGAAAYLLASALIYKIGFPLDDSWIHLTYARNLAVHGQWAFQLGHPSAGSTAPLWTFLLSLGYWLPGAPYFWTYFLGGLILLLLGLVSELGARALVPEYKARIPWIGLFMILEWHLLWAAMSGMETILHALLATAVLILLMTGSRRYLALGLLSGISIWVRPDGLTLVGPVVLVIMLAERSFRERSRTLLLFLIGLGTFLLPYLLFNLWLSGTPMPNTFYAKQTEYAAWQAQSIGSRLLVLLVQLLTGPSVLLLPGVVGSAVLAVRRRQWGMIASLLWCIGYLTLYILRLPAYQHGRYLMPAMPVFFLLGLLGYLEFQKSTMFKTYHWLVLTTWQVSLASLTILFVILGARSYGEDVGLIESEMVATAKWVSANIPSGKIIAAHDIGALGYYDNHPLIDLAGLVSPEVIPFMRNETQLADFINQHHADYLIAFPAFYPQLTREAVPIFISEGKFAPEIGEKNMTVYLWNAPK